MNNLKIIFGILIFVTICFFGLKHLSTNKKTETKFNIGILQFASHPALDQGRDGFIEKLKKELGKEVNFIIQNAQGCMQSALSAAQSFHLNKKIDAIHAIGTSAAQIASKVEKEKPIFFSIVTDPVAAGLIHPGTNCCGSSDKIDIKGLVETLKLLVPNAKNIALIFNPAEINSIKSVEEIKKELRNLNLNPLEFGINDESEVAFVTNLACRKADAIITPTDNIVAVTIKVISNIALKNKIPLIVSDNLLVKHGPLGSRGIDFREIGKKAAKQAIEVLIKGKKPEEMPIAFSSKNTMSINKKTLSELKIEIPENLKQDIKFI